MVDSRELLSIEGETKFPNQPLSTLPTEDTFPDTTLYEIKQFLKLAIKGTTILTLLGGYRSVINAPRF
jgi:hypothetical protein